VNQGPRDETVIRTPDRRLRVFVSSTLGELAEERRAVSRAISALRLSPVMFELSGALPRLLYVRTPAPDREPRLADLLERIQAEASASYRRFRTPAELGRLVRDGLRTYGGRRPTWWPRSASGTLVRT
jgi:Domain of unknown function (DUF4062)